MIDTKDVLMGCRIFVKFFSMAIASIVLTSSFFWPNQSTAAVLHDDSLQWYTIESEHFRCHFHTGEEALARRSLVIAENVHAELSVMMDWLPEDKTTIILTDEYDDPNGYATPFPENRSGIYVSAPDSVDGLEDNSDWLETVIKHEYLHILHLDKATGNAAYMRKIFGRAEYIFPIFTAFPNSFQPGWIIEGLATYSETDKERGVGRGQSSYFDMLMRMEALGNFKPLSQINMPNVTDWPLNTTRYLYGVNFFQFIDKQYGKQKITDFVDNYSNNIIPWQLNSNAEESLGKNLYDLWDEFETDTKQKYKKQSDTIKTRGEIIGKQLTFDGFFAGPLKVLDNGEIYYVDYNVEQRRTLKVIRPNKKGEYSRPVDIIELDSEVRFDIHPVAGIVLAKPERCRTAAVYYDLFHVDVKTAKQTRLTTCGRYKRVAWSQDGKKLIAVKSSLAKNELHLLDNNGKLIDTLWKGTYGDVISSFDWSPTENKIIASVYRKSSGWNLEIFNIEDKTWMFVTNDDAIETTPSYSADGKSILFSSDHGGIYNLRSLTIKEKKADEDKQTTVKQQQRLMPFVDTSLNNAEIIYSDDSSKVTLDSEKDTSKDTKTTVSALLVNNDDKTKIENTSKSQSAEKTLSIEMKSLTDLIGGAFYPAQTKNKNEVIYIGYTSAGFDVFKLELKQTGVIPVPKAIARPTAIAKENKLTEQDLKLSPVNDYSASGSLLPRWFHPIINVSDSFYEVGAFTYSWDALARHIYRFSASYVDFESDYTDWAGSVHYVYDRYNPIFKLSASHGNEVFRTSADGLVRVRSNNIFQAEAVFPILSMQDKLSFHIAAVQESESDSWRKNSSYTPINKLDENLIGAALVYNNTAQHARSISRAEGRVIQLTAEDSDGFGNSDYQGNVVTLDWREFIHLGKTHVLAIRGVFANGGINSKPFRLGGTNENNFEPQFLNPAIASSPFNRREYNLRGYDEGFAELVGKNMRLMSLEYRFPIWRLERGLMSPPVGIQNFSGSIFVDRGRAWNDNVSKNSYTGIGAELYSDILFGYHRVMRLTLGYADGQDDVLGKEQYYLRLGMSF